jgi:Zn-dependent alcohol dehydrogenase
MKTKAAILWKVNTPWSVEEIDLDRPKRGEVLVKIKAAGLCHSEEHVVTGAAAFTPEMIQALGRDQIPVIGGHEGAGVVIEVGEGVASLAPGDHVAASFIPSCGRCYWCSTGKQNLCDLGARLFAPGMITDATDRHHARGQWVNTYCKVGTFAAHRRRGPGGV